MDNFAYGLNDYVHGTKDHKIDAKSRIAIPASMRSFLGQEFVIGIGLDKYIALYPLHEWNSRLTKISNSKLPTTRKEYISRMFSANSERASLDSQGRVVLPERFQKFADILGDKEARIIGNINHIEIWKITDDVDGFEDLGAMMDEVDQSYENELLGFGK